MSVLPSRRCCARLIGHGVLRRPGPLRQCRPRWRGAGPTFSPDGARRRPSAVTCDSGSVVARHDRCSSSRGWPGPVKERLTAGPERALDGAWVKARAPRTHLAGTRRLPDSRRRRLFRRRTTKRRSPRRRPSGVPGPHAGENGSALVELCAIEPADLSF